MQPRRITVIDVVSLGRKKRTIGRLMNINLASLMPQAVAAWCQELGHRVRFVCYTGPEDLDGVLDDTDLLFLSAFTRAAQTAYAISSLARRRGIVTALGGPHARCYPQDAARYFDYVLGLTDKTIVADVVQDGGPHRPLGRRLSALRQPIELPGARQRWPFIAATIARAPFFKTVPMLGSMGCPYTCSFCIDLTVPYQPLGFEQIADDLRFLRTRLRHPRVAWLDPNFGVRFDDYLGTIERAVPPGSVRFIAESSLSLLSEPNLKRLAAAGFDAVLPGIESWYGLGNKSRTGAAVGMDKVRRVADHINLIMRYVPYVQANFVFGLDSDEGDEPFELTKRFLDLAPGAYPAFSLLTAYGQAAPINLALQREGRVLPFPFRFLDSLHAMNVRPRNYSWPTFYDHVIDLNRHALSRRSMGRRFLANSGIGTRLINAVRAGTSNRVEYHSRIRGLLDSDAGVRRFFEGDSRRLPGFYQSRLRNSLGPLWESLPPEAVMHDELAYLHDSEAAAA